jgi:hypothetical protein
METFRNREIFVRDGYMYIFNKLSTDGKNKFWRCRYKDLCKARIHTSIETSKVI